MKLNTCSLSYLLIPLTLLAPVQSALAQVFSGQAVPLSVGSQSPVPTENVFTNNDGNVVLLIVPGQTQPSRYHSTSKGKVSSRKKDDSQEETSYTLESDSQADEIELEGFESFEFEGSLEKAEALDY